MNDFGSQTRGQEQLPGGGAPPSSPREVRLAEEMTKLSHDCDFPPSSLSATSSVRRVFRVPTICELIRGINL